MNRSAVNRIFSLTALCAAMLPAMQASAAGFQVSEHSAAGLGRAFAGEAAIADDASVVARNPAGMSLIESTTITVAGTYVAPNIRIKDDKGVTPSGAGNVGNEGFVPALYVVIPLENQLTVGFGANTNYAFGTQYGRSSGLSNHAHKSEVTSANFNGSVAYQLTEEFSLGFGLNAVHTKAELTSTGPAPAPIPSALGGSDKDLLAMKGDDWSFGWNAGALWQVAEETRVGLSYRSEVKNTVKGKVKSDIMDGRQLPPGSPIPRLPNWNTKGSVDLNLPAIAELSVSHQLNDAVALHASVMRTFWSTFKEIKFDLENGAKIPTVQEHWNDVNRYAVGATWQYDPHWTLRAGIAKDESPVDDRYRTFRIPDTDRMWYTAGASYKISDNHDVDFGYGYVKGGSAKIYENKGAVQGEIASSTAHLFSAQYNYRF